MFFLYFNIFGGLFYVCIFYLFFFGIFYFVFFVQSMFLCLKKCYHWQLYFISKLAIYLIWWLLIYQHCSHYVMIIMVITVTHIPYKLIVIISVLVLLFFLCFFFILIFLEGCFMFAFFYLFFFILVFFLYILFWIFCCIFLSNQCFYASKNVIDNYILFQSWLFISYDGLNISTFVVTTSCSLW